MKARKRITLLEEIRSFRRMKIVYAIPLIFIGLLGLVLPIIPGILLIVYGIMLLFPRFGRNFTA